MTTRIKSQNIVILRESGVSIFDSMNVVIMDSRFRGNDEFKTII